MDITDFTDVQYITNITVMGVIRDHENHCYQGRINHHITVSMDITVSHIYTVADKKFFVVVIISIKYYCCFDVLLFFSCISEGNCYHFDGVTR
jgi:hypothetical protein